MQQNQQQEPDEIQEKINSLIAELRKERMDQQMSFYNLSDATGIRHPNLVRLEKSKDRVPSLRTFLIVAEALGVDVRLQKSYDAPFSPEQKQSLFEYFYKKFGVPLSESDYMQIHTILNQ